MKTKTKKKKNKKKKFSFSLENNGFSLLEVSIIAFICILFGIVIGYFIMTYKNSVSFSSPLQEVIDTYQNIVNQYYEEVDQKELSSFAIRGMMDSLEDNYSSYMDETTTYDFQDSIDGSFSGIGVRVLFDGEYNRIVEVMESSPAEEVGLLVGDVIVEVDEKDVKGLFQEGISRLIRGEENTKVKITVLREEEKKTFTIPRKNIELSSVSSSLFEVEGSTVGYIQISSFSSRTYSQFVKVLKGLEEQSITTLIIDLRDNPGGQLSQTKNILDLFFPKKTVLYQTQTKTEKEKVYAETKEKRNYQVFFLVNGNSASASEIMVSCFQEQYSNVKIFGENTYGKGMIQKSQMLSNGTSIKYTTQKWFTSKGEWLEGKGIIPDVFIEQNPSYYENPTYENDVVLQKALDTIKES